MDVGAYEIDRWHRQKGYFRIGYHFVIRRDGTIEKGRALDEIGAHVQGYNNKSIGICMVGGTDPQGRPENNFTPEQFDKLKFLLQALTADYPKAIVQGHRDFPGVKKDCPCFDVKKWWEENK